MLTWKEHGRRPAGDTPERRDYDKVNAILEPVEDEIKVPLSDELIAQVDAAVRQDRRLPRALEHPPRARARLGSGTDHARHDGRRVRRRIRRNHRFRGQRPARPFALIRRTSVQYFRVRLAQPMTPPCPQGRARGACCPPSAASGRSTSRSSPPRSSCSPAPSSTSRSSTSACTSRGGGWRWASSRLSAAWSTCTSAAARTRSRSTPPSRPPGSRASSSSPPPATAARAATPSPTRRATTPTSSPSAPSTTTAPRTISDDVPDELVEPRHDAGRLRQARHLRAGRQDRLEPRAGLGLHEAVRRVRHRRWRVHPRRRHLDGRPDGRGRRGARLPARPVADPEPRSRRCCATPTAR